MNAPPRPSVTLKLATSLDGRIATQSGESKWITSEEARAQGHRLRAEHDVVLIGSQTLIEDDPELSVRIADFNGAQPIRAVADGRFRATPDMKLFASAKPGQPVVLITAEGGPGEAAVKAGGFPAAVRFSFIGRGADGALDPAAILRACGFAAHAEKRRAYQDARVLIEGGGVLAAAFMRAGLIDRLEWFRAAMVLGADGRAGLGDLGVNALADAPRFVRQSATALGPDLWERYVRA